MPFQSDEWKRIDTLIRLALEEDIGPGDITTEALFPQPVSKTARITAKSRGIVAGIPVIERVYGLIDDRLSFRWQVKDGDRCSPKQTIGYIEGKISGILQGERIALNFLGRLSGIAAITAATVELLDKTGAVLLDTRKTTPGWRALEKYAVRMGGGRNHRTGLFDMIMVKDTHIDASLSFQEAVKRAVTYRRDTKPAVKIEIETATLEQVREALAGGADIIMLDNMSPEEMTEAVQVIAGRAKTEASGGITPDRLSTVAETGVNYISMGALTHSASSLDFSMKIVTE